MHKFFVLEIPLLGIFFFFNQYTHIHQECIRQFKALFIIVTNWIQLKCPHRVEVN